MLMHDRTDGNLRPPSLVARAAYCRDGDQHATRPSVRSRCLAQTYTSLLFAAPLLITLLAIPILHRKPVS